MSRGRKAGRRLERIYRFILRENIHNVLLVVLAIILVSGLAISLLEPGIDFAAGIWWSIVTLTTVGYGDISPTTTGGRVVAVLIMFFGIGLLGTLSASLASLLIVKRMKENRGMSGSEVKDHIIICEWNHRSGAILRELRADAKMEQAPVVLIADLEYTPVDDPDLLFISGTVNEETLQKANLAEARTVIVVGDDRLEATARDAKAVLTTLTIESLNPDVYTVVELVDKANERHCLRARADEIIIGSELSSHLLASAAIDHGLSRIVHELLSSDYGNELFSMPLPVSLAGRTFLDIMVYMKKERDTTVLGVQKGRDGKLISNPTGDTVVEEGDSLLVISRNRFSC